MNVSENLLKRLNELLESGSAISSEVRLDFGLTFSENIQAQAWLASCQNLVHVLVSDLSNPYRMSATAVGAAASVQASSVRGLKRTTVDSMLGLMRGLKADVEAGLISRIVDRIAAEVFDDFLDHASDYHKRGRKESGVIAGVVFEDTMRKLASRNGIVANDVEAIIVELVKRQVFTEPKAKRARAAAAVRTKATHAKWDEFDLKDVDACIQFTRELINELT